MKLGTNVGLVPGHVVLERYGDPSSHKGTAAHLTFGPCIVDKRLFGPCLLWPNSMQIGLGPCHIVLDGDPAASKRLDASRCHLVGRTRIGLCLGDIVLDKDAASLSLPKRRTASPLFWAHVC